MDININRNAIVQIRLGALCTDMMAAIRYGATPPYECLVDEVAVRAASDFVREMFNKGHLTVAVAEEGEAVQEELKALQKILQDGLSADFLQKYGTEWSVAETLMYARASIEGSEFGTWTMRKSLAWYADDEEQFLRGDGAPYASVPPRVSSTAKASRAALRRIGRNGRLALRARAVLAVKDRHELRTENRLLREAIDWLSQCEELCHWYDYFKCHPLMWGQVKYKQVAHCEAYASRHHAFEEARAAAEGGEV